MTYAHLNYDDPSIEIIENALFIVKNIRFDNLSSQENGAMSRTAGAVLKKLEAKSDKITPANLAAMCSAVSTVSVVLKDNEDLYRQLFVSPSVELHEYIQLLESAASALEAWALQIGLQVHPTL